MVGGFVAKGTNELFIKAYLLVFCKSFSKKHSLQKNPVKEPGSKPH